MEAMGHADPVAVWKCAGPDTSLRLRCPGKSQESFCEPQPFSGSDYLPREGGEWEDCFTGGTQGRKVGLLQI